MLLGRGHLLIVGVPRGSPAVAPGGQHI